MQKTLESLSQEIFSEITKAQKILMHCHPNPDADSIGSTLALYHALKSIGKEPTVIKGDSNLPQYLSILPGYTEIVKKNIFEVDLKEFDLFLILDSGSPNQITKLGELNFPLEIKTIVIDHHRSNTSYADINLIDNSYPATCQIVYDLLNEWSIPLNANIALNLFIGTYTDTGGFRFKPTSQKTLASASKLVELAPNFTDALFFMENCNTKGRLILQGRMLSHIETFFSDSVAFASISRAEIDLLGITEDDMAGIDVANLLKTVVGWNLGVSLIEVEQNKVKISFRTRDNRIFDVSKVALLVGGGGHAGAAGAQIIGTLDEAKEKVIEAIKEAYPYIK
jgi:bifunctional oligoribonuclease and PAP phosphatase NrnA